MSRLEFNNAVFKSVNNDCLFTDPVRESQLVEVRAGGLRLCPEFVRASGDLLQERGKFQSLRHQRPAHGAVVSVRLLCAGSTHVGHAPPHHRLQAARLLVAAAVHGLPRVELDALVVRLLVLLLPLVRGVCNTKNKAL